MNLQSESFLIFFFFLMKLIEHKFFLIFCKIKLNSTFPNSDRIQQWLIWHGIKFEKPS